MHLRLFDKTMEYVENMRVFLEGGTKELILKLAEQLTASLNKKD